MGGGRLLGILHRIAQVGEVVAAELRTHLGEVLVLLLLDVVAHVLDEHGGLGLEALVGGVHVVELIEQPLHDVVLLEALEHDVIDLLDGGPGDRVEDLLLDHRVLRELLDDLIDDLATLDERPVAGLLEALEELLDGLVVLFEQGDGVHRRGTTPYPASRNRTQRAALTDIRGGRIGVGTGPLARDPRRRTAGPVEAGLTGPPDG